MNIKHIAVALIIPAVLCVSISAEAAQCKVGAHQGNSWIKSHNKNCTNCGTQKDSEGKTVYYCYCDCGDSEDKKVAKSTQKQTKTKLKDKNSTNEAVKRASTSAAEKKVSKTKALCQEQGSHVSIEFIKTHYKNCSNCRTENVPAEKCEKNKKAHKHYYCMCGEGCTAVSSASKKTDKNEKTESKCANNQWKHGNSCEKCPENASCNGTKFSCKKNFEVKGNACVEKKTTSATTSEKKSSSNVKNEQKKTTNSSSGQGRVFKNIVNEVKKAGGQTNNNQSNKKTGTTSTPRNSWAWRLWNQIQKQQK